jgi:hypothetical protein
MYTKCGLSDSPSEEIAYLEETGVDGRIAFNLL